MGFVAENFTKNMFEPLVNRKRGWAAIRSTTAREGRLFIILYRLEDLDMIGIRDDKGRLIELPPQPNIALSAISAVLRFRAATGDETAQRPGLENVAIYKLQMNNRGYASTHLVPGCDWTQSKEIYQEAVIGWELARTQVATDPNKTLVTFE